MTQLEKMLFSYRSIVTSVRPLSTMSNNIKDPDVHRLARDLARMSGKSMTRIVRESLEARYEVLARDKQRAGVDELMNIARRVSNEAISDAPDHGELLYDELGLPR